MSGSERFTTAPQAINPDLLDREKIASYDTSGAFIREYHPVGLIGIKYAQDPHYSLCYQRPSENGHLQQTEVILGAAGTPLEVTGPMGMRSRLPDEMDRRLLGVITGSLVLDNDGRAFALSADKRHYTCVDDPRVSHRRDALFYDCSDNPQDFRGHSFFAKMPPLSLNAADTAVVLGLIQNGLEYADVQAERDRAVAILAQDERLQAFGDWRTLLHQMEANLRINQAEPTSQGAVEIYSVQQAKTKTGERVTHLYAAKNETGSDQQPVTTRMRITVQRDKTLVLEHAVAGRHGTEWQRYDDPMDEVNILNALRSPAGRSNTELGSIAYGDQHDTVIMKVNPHAGAERLFDIDDYPRQTLVVHRITAQEYQVRAYENGRCLNPHRLRVAKTEEAQQHIAIASGTPPVLSREQTHQQFAEKRKQLERTYCAQAFGPVVDQLISANSNLIAILPATRERLIQNLASAAMQRDQLRSGRLLVGNVQLSRSVEQFAQPKHNPTVDFIWVHDTFNTFLGLPTATNYALTREGCKATKMRIFQARGNELVHDLVMRNLLEVLDRPRLTIDSENDLIMGLQRRDGTVVIAVNDREHTTQMSIDRMGMLKQVSQPDGTVATTTLGDTMQDGALRATAGFIRGQNQMDLFSQRLIPVQQAAQPIFGQHLIGVRAEGVMTATEVAEVYEAGKRVWVRGKIESQADLVAQAARSAGISLPVVASRELGSKLAQTSQILERENRTHLGRLPGAIAVTDVQVDPHTAALTVIVSIQDSARDLQKGKVANVKVTLEVQQGESPMVTVNGSTADITGIGGRMLAAVLATDTLRTTDENVYFKIRQTWIAQQTDLIHEQVESDADGVHSNGVVIKQAGQTDRVIDTEQSEVRVGRRQPRPSTVFEDALGTYTANQPFAIVSGPEVQAVMQSLEREALLDEAVAAATANEPLVAIPGIAGGRSQLLTAVALQSEAHLDVTGGTHHQKIAKLARQVVAGKDLHISSHHNLNTQRGGENKLVVRRIQQDGEPYILVGFEDQPGVPVENGHLLKEAMIDGVPVLQNVGYIQRQGRGRLGPDDNPTYTCRNQWSDQMILQQRRLLGRRYGKDSPLFVEAALDHIEQATAAAAGRVVEAIPPQLRQGYLLGSSDFSEAIVQGTVCGQAGVDEPDEMPEGGLAVAIAQASTQPFRVQKFPNAPCPAGVSWKGN